jgi:hypothetical protein
MRRRLVIFHPGGDLMKAKKKSGKGKAAGKRGVKDLPASAKARNAKGGGMLSSATNDVMKSIGSALQTGARGG